MFNFILFSFLITLLFLIISTIYDFKYRIIPNKLILLFLIIGFITIILQTIFLHSFSIFVNSMISLGITIILGYLLWEIGLFAGGDVKLFIVISILNPVNLNYFGYLLNTTVTKTPVFSINLLLTSILCVIPVLVVIAIYKFIFNKYYLILYNILKKKSTYISIFNSIFLIYFITSFSNIFALSTPIILIYIFSIIFLIFFNKVQKYNEKYFYYFLLILYALLFLFTYLSKSISSNIFKLSDLINISLIIISIYFLVVIYRIISNYIFSKEIDIKYLKEGDVTFNNYYFYKNKLIVKDTGFLKTITQMLSGKYYNHLIIDSSKVGGLNKQDIKFLNKLYSNNSIDRNIKLKKTIPFTIYVLIAYILLNFIGDVVWSLL